jgi:pimeloyl-ACP methyl ester carboxylesterase
MTPVETPFGEIWLHGRRPPSKLGGLVVLAITGAFGGRGRPVFELEALLPEVDIYAAQLPGYECPALVATSIGVWAAAFSHAAQEVFGDRPLVIVGESLGALVAMAMRVPSIRWLLLLEPPLVTGGLWPLVEPLRQKARDDPSAKQVVENVFGYLPDEIASRDYRHLLAELSRPAVIVIGDDLLGEPRPFEWMPSLVQEPERVLMRDHPKVVTVHFIGAGHDVFGRGPAEVLKILREVIQESEKALVR